MVKNRRAKGMHNERKAELELQQEGWITQRAPPPNKFSKRTDLLGLFDIEAIQKILGTKKTKWIQVKTNASVGGKALQPFIEFKEKNCDQNDSVEIWSWYDRKGWKKKIL